MDNKNTNNQKGNTVQHAFEVHTMKTDSELRATAPTAPINQSAQHTPSSPPKKNIEPHKIPQHPSANPFLENGVLDDTVGEKRPSFGAKKKDPLVAEKINFSPADIAPKPDQKNTQMPKNNKSVLMGMIVFVIIFLCGVAGFGFYLWQKNYTATTAEIDEPLEDTTVITNDDLIDNTPVVEQIYSTVMSNNFSFDVESATAAEDVKKELAMITQGLRGSDIEQPVSFIVTDQNDNPVSFHIFALSADITLPITVSSALEEGFEIYAYNDPINGVRFGFVIDVKNINGLQEALALSERELPQAFALVLGDVIIDMNGLNFGDSVYNTHPVRYVNLNADESYSIDYTITNQKLVIGTTKDTLRAIVDVIKSETTFEQY